MCFRVTFPLESSPCRITSIGAYILLMLRMSPLTGRTSSCKGEWVSCREVGHRRFLECPTACGTVTLKRLSLCDNRMTGWIPSARRSVPLNDLDQLRGSSAFNTLINTPRVALLLSVNRNDLTATHKSDASTLNSLSPCCPCVPLFHQHQSI